MLIIYTINAIFCGLTTWKIVGPKNELKSIMSKESARKMKKTRDRYVIPFSFLACKIFCNIFLLNLRYSIFIRIFILMGVSWITEAIAAFFKDRDTPYFLFTDILNCMQGVFLFACLVLKENVLQRIIK